jgi:predicted phage terminase large subunit-like protein
VIAPTYADARDTCVEGDSGLRAIIPPACIEAWNRSLGELILVNESRFKLFAAEEPERLRGPQHHRAWCDELGAWRYAETWDQMLFGLRLGLNPQAVVTTTPRPNPLMLQLVKTAGTVITRGSTFDNAEHLAPAALAQLRERYEGTRLGRQELEAELLTDVPGAMWTRAMIDAARVKDMPEMSRVVVAIDPSGTSGNDEGDDVGIIVAGRGVDGRAYVIADETCRLSPDGWARRAITAYHRHKADRIVAERNFGGAMVESVIRAADRSVAYKEVTASRGKAVRAEPVSALYEQGRVSHVGSLDKLEDQMVLMTAGGYAGEGSPDRVDALVWALTEVMLGWQMPERSGDAVSIPTLQSAFNRRQSPRASIPTLR